MSPGTAGACLGIEDQKIRPSATQIIAKGQPHLATADDDDVPLGHCIVCRIMPTVGKQVVLRRVTHVEDLTATNPGYISSLVERSNNG